MKKIFISQPMNGKTPEEIASARKKAIETVTKYVKCAYGNTETIEVLDNLLEIPSGKNSIYREGQCLLILSDADVAIFCNGWNHASGCTIEWRASRVYGVPVVIDDNSDRSDPGRTSEMRIIKRDDSGAKKKN